MYDNTLDLHVECYMLNAGKQCVHRQSHIGTVPLRYDTNQIFIHNTLSAIDFAFICEINRGVYCMLVVFDGLLFYGCRCCVQGVNYLKKSVSLASD